MFTPTTSGCRRQLSRALSRNAKIDLIVGIMLLGFAVSVFIQGWLGVYFPAGHLPHPFMPTYARFLDFTLIRDVSNNPLSDYSQVDYTYNNFFLYLVGLLTFIPQKLAIIGYFTFFLLCLLYFTYVNVRSSSAFTTLLRVFVIALLAYPVQFAIDHGNFETLTFIVLYLFVNSYQANQQWQTIFWYAFALITKPFPIIFLPMFVKDRKIKALVIALVIFAALTLYGFCQFAGLAHNLHRHLTSLAAYNYDYAIETAGLYCAHSLWGVFRAGVAIVLLAKHGHVADQIKTFEIHTLKFYYLFAVLAFSCLTLYLWKIERCFWKQIALLICAMNLLPAVSSDYKLMHFLIPMFLFINSPRQRYDGAYAMLFALLLIQKDYFSPSTSVPVSISIVINPLLMVLLVGLIVYDGMAARKNLECGVRVALV